jgi:hypothetical protein
MAQSIFIPKVPTASDLAALDYFTAADARYPPAGTGQPAPINRNSHDLLAYANPGNQWAYFPGVMGKDYGGLILTVELFWAATVGIGNVVWFVAWERDEATFFVPGVNLDVNSFAAEKAVISPAPVAVGDLRRAVLVFTNAEADGVMAGDPYRLRVRRSGGSASDDMGGAAQLFRISLEGL